MNQVKFLVSLSSPTRDFHSCSRSFMIRFQPKRLAKLRTVLQSTHLAISPTNFCFPWINVSAILPQFFEPSNFLSQLSFPLEVQENGIQLCTVLQYYCREWWGVLLHQCMLLYVGTVVHGLVVSLLEFRSGDP